MKTSDLYTKPTFDGGKSMPIILPSGETIKETLKLIGSDSDIFAGEMARTRKLEIDLIGQKEKLSPLEYAKKEKSIKIELLSSLVIGWTFEEEFSPEAVRVLFLNAPYVMEQVDSFSGTRSNFFVNPSTD